MKIILYKFLFLITLLSLLTFVSVKENTDLKQGSINFLKTFHLDCGRKYFSVLQIKDIIDTMAKYNYNTLELAIGNDGLRFLLDDLSLETNSKNLERRNFESDQVKKAISSGNKNYYDSKTNELTENEMDEIIEYANEKNIEIIPLINSPGHMDAILYACSSLLGEDCSYHRSKRTIDITNSMAVDFTYKLINKYIEYFKKKNTHFFNLGGDEYANDIYSSGSMGFGNLVKEGNYKYFIDYINNLAKLIKEAEMTPIAFNDGFYFGGDTKSGTLDKDIIVSYWSNGWGDYKLSPAENLFKMGYKILNTHYDWYYVLNWSAISGGSTTFKNTLKGIMNNPYNKIIGGNEMEVIGCMICFWCDQPKYEYDETEEGYLKRQISEFASTNKAIFDVEEN